MTDRGKEFLMKLAGLCEDYRASFHYTIMDDGTHIHIDGHGLGGDIGEVVFAGHLYDGDECWRLLEQAAKEDGVRHERTD